MDSGPGYKSWKNKEEPNKKNDLNMGSFTEFPDLVKEPKKKSAFEGTSLAAKLKETIAAEEEAAILKRLKKGDTPEMILRESCAVLPLKGGPYRAEPLIVPDWVMDTTLPTVFPPFRHKTLEQLAHERRLRRLGVSPRDTRLFDETDYEEPDDAVSIPSETSSVGDDEMDMVESEEI